MKQYAYLGNNIGVMRLNSIGSILFDTRDIGMTNVLMNDHVDTYEPDVVAYLENSISEGCVFIDVGANVGLHTIRAARIANRKITISSFEPNPDIFTLLTKNIKINGMGTCAVATRKAAFDKAGEFEFSFDPDNHRVGRLSTDGETVFDNKFTVKAVTLDAECASLRGKKTVIKIDVEGGELAVLNGARDLIQDAPNISIIFELNSRGIDKDLEVLRWLQDGRFSFKTFEAGALVEKPIEFFEGRSGHFNILAIRK